MGIRIHAPLGTCGPTLAAGPLRPSQRHPQTPPSGCGGCISDSASKVDGDEIVGEAVPELYYEHLEEAPAVRVRPAGRKAAACSRCRSNPGGGL